MLEKIENNLKEAYENLCWEERKVLLDNLNGSLWKGDISLDEFEKSATYLKKSCPDADAKRWAEYWSGEGVKFTFLLIDNLIREKIKRCFYQGMMLEEYLDLSFSYQVIGDTLFSSLEDYQKTKEELCRYLRYYGLTDEQEQLIMQGGSLADNMKLIFDYLNQKNS